MTEKNSDAAKYGQIKKEAAWTGAVLGLLILFWLVAGFGVSRVDIVVFHIPLWAITATVGVWFAAIVAVKLLLVFVFRDMPLEATEEKDNG